MSYAQMRPILKHRVGVPPFEVLKKILETNMSPTSPPRLSNTKMAHQAPYITWLADSDARVEPRFILPADSGLIYSVRNLANQLVVSQGAVDYGVRYLHTPVLLITGNTDSEALGILLTDHETLPTAIQTDLDHLFLPVKESAQDKKKGKLPLAKKVQILVEKNVDHQVEKALDLYVDRIRGGRLVVIGAVLDISNQYGNGKNRLLVININGEKRQKALRRLPLTNNLSPGLKKFLGRQPAASRTK
ncbi:MAG: carbonic anhydrase [Thermodesulfobacteriota bacterium]